MLPIILAENARVGLLGEGDALGRRASLLLESGIRAELISTECDESRFSGLKLLFIAGLDEDRSRAMAACARALGVLVNVEDIPELCDFHVPAIVRRGDLLLTVSTGGRAPALARRVREWIEQEFGSEWQGRLDRLAESRERWIAEGVASTGVSERTRDFVTEQGWLP